MEDLAGPPIGERMRQRRQELHMSLDELAEQTGLSKGFLSQVERSISRPSIDSLAVIANALGVPMFLFFVEDSHARIVVRNDERRDVDAPDSRFRYQSIWFTPDRKMEIITGRLDPGECNVDEPAGHPTRGLESVDEFALVLQGQMMLEVSGESHILGEGDSAYFNGNLPHRYTNVGEVELVVLFAIAPPALSR